MPDAPDAPGPEDGVDVETFTDGVDDTPTVSCSRCDRTWDLSYELDDLQVGNRALERFALDHRRHTGHFPDDVTPWVTDCLQCPDEDAFLSEDPARRWAETHARHTRHEVRLDPPVGGEQLVGGDGGSSGDSGTDTDGEADADADGE